MARTNSRYHKKLFRNLNNVRSRQRTKIITVPAFLPLSLALKARRKIYTYPFPAQRQLSRFSIRDRLGRRRGKFVPTLVKIRVPRVLPLVKQSMVEWQHGKQTIRSKKAISRVLSRGELNRVRYLEGKSGYRKARNGQADSPGFSAHGLVAEAVRKKLSPARIADHALVARAIR